MGRFSRSKGLRGERNIVNAFQDAGFGAERIPLSGAAGGSFVGDLSIPVNGADWKGEVKVRADGFATLYRWLGANRLLFLKADRQEQLVVMRQSDFIEVLKHKQG